MGMQFRQNFSASKLCITYPLRFLPGTSIEFGPPRKAVLKSKDWFASLGKTEKEKHKYHALFSETAVIRKLPEYADPPIGKLYSSMQEGLIPERFVMELSGGRYWGHGILLKLWPCKTQKIMILGAFSSRFFCRIIVFGKAKERNGDYEHQSSQKVLSLQRIY